MVNAVDHIDVTTPWITNERFATRIAAAAAVAGGGGVLGGIRLGFHNHPTEQAAVLLAFHHQATHEVGGD